MREDATPGGSGPRRRGKAREGSLLSLIVGFSGTSVWKDRSLRELLHWAEDLADAAGSARPGDGGLGVDRSLSVHGAGLILHAHFPGGLIRFTIHANPFEEPSPDDPITNREALSGAMRVECLKETLRLLADGCSPLFSLWSNANRLRLHRQDRGPFGPGV
jgi:hypothetical protein